jgi:hypothetical protein
LSRYVAITFVVLALFAFACKSDRKSKNDEIAACTATGGHWSEGGCNDNGHCDKTSGMDPGDDDDGDEEPDEVDASAS